MTNDRYSLFDLCSELLDEYLVCYADTEIAALAAEVTCTDLLLRSLEPEPLAKMTDNLLLVA